MDHDSSAAALIYQHATSEADQAIAKAMNAAGEADPHGTAKGARKRPHSADPGSAGGLAKVS
jgi:hypothetical protein